MPPVHANSGQPLGNLPSFQLNIRRTTQILNDKTGNTLSSLGDTAHAITHTIGATTSTVAQSIATTITNPETIIKPEPSYQTPEIKEVATISSANGSGGPTTTQLSPPVSAPTIAPSLQASPTYIWPLHGVVTTEFGVYHQPFQDHHTGIDIASGLPIGAAVVTSVRQGVVAEVIRSSGGLGNHVVIDHGSGLTSWYGHLSSVAVTEGRPVKPGDIIGYEGRTGATTGPHLHLEIRQNNIPLNPRKFITGNP